MSAPWFSRCRPKAGCRKTPKPSSRAPASTLIKPRGARDYRGAIAGLDGVEVAYLSAAEITGQLAQGAVHLGVTGEDLVREMIPDADGRVVLIEGLGFGFANVVVAVPQAWIDVRTMADLDDVATAFRHQPRPQDAGGDQIREPDARLLLRSTASSTIASSKARARPKARRPPAPPR